MKIHYREYGEGFPLLFLHGGWGYEVYPFDQQIKEFSSRFQILIPDRTGYGRSHRVDSLPADFHARAAVESAAFLDALDIDRCVLWGHSDGAVIAAMMGLAAPKRYAGILLEAFHYYRLKPRSLPFFAGGFDDTTKLSERITGILAHDHGPEDWPEVLRNGANAWLEIARRTRDPQDDLYDGRLNELIAPTILIHGSDDPRTEPDELDRIRRALPHTPINIIEGGAHAPHSERDVVDQVNSAAAAFLDRTLEEEAK